LPRTRRPPWTSSKSIEQKGGSAYAIQAEFGTDGRRGKRCFEQLDATLGDRPLDILVNNAGMLDGSPFGTGANGCVRTAATPIKRASTLLYHPARTAASPRNGGRIVNISSQPSPASLHPSSTMR